MKNDVLTFSNLFPQERTAGSFTLQISKWNNRSLIGEYLHISYE